MSLPPRLPRKPPKPTVSFSCPPDRIARLKAIGAKEGHSVSALIVQAVDEWLERYDKGKR